MARGGDWGKADFSKVVGWPAALLRAQCAWSTAPEQRASAGLETQGLVVLCLGRMVQAEGSYEMGELGWCGSRRPLGQRS